jgi:hypothetical protein
VAQGLVAAGAVVAFGACAEPFTIDGPPGIELGTGEYAYEPVEDGQDIPLIHGPQGGYHVWVGLRMRDMNPNGMRLDTAVELADTATPVGRPLFFRFTMFRGESGEFEYAGLPEQLEPAEVEGRAIRIEVVATDRGGRTATDAMIAIPR